MYIFATRDAWRKQTTVAKWTRCFLIDMNDLIWRFLVQYFKIFVMAFLNVIEA